MSADLLAALGIPQTYGQDPPLPRFAEATALVDVEPNVIGRMQQLSAPTAHAWLEMKAHAADDGILLLLVSGFRSIERQAELIRSKLDRGQILAEILAVNAAPGFSQHHTGCAVDLATPGCAPLTEPFETTDAFAWLGRHASRFGFTMPYGRNNAFGFCHEPWHWFHRQA